MGEARGLNFFFFLNTHASILVMFAVDKSFSMLASFACKATDKGF